MCGRATPTIPPYACRLPRARPARCRGSSGQPTRRTASSSAALTQHRRRAASSSARPWRSAKPKRAPHTAMPSGDGEQAASSISGTIRGGRAEKGQPAAARRAAAAAASRAAASPLAGTLAVLGVPAPPAWPRPPPTFSPQLWQQLLLLGAQQDVRDLRGAVEVKEAWEGRADGEQARAAPLPEPAGWLDTHRAHKRRLEDCALTSTCRAATQTSAERCTQRGRRALPPARWRRPRRPARQVGRSIVSSCREARTELGVLSG